MDIILLERVEKLGTIGDVVTVKDGYVDDGWKDTILLMPGERVQIQLAFKDFTGLFLYHCHNLEHEDMFMMARFDVV